MAQTGYTPILIYSSSTTTNVPSAGNLTNSTLGSELAINITDGKLFYKDNSNNVQVIGWKTVPTSAGGTGLTSYTAGDLLYYATGTTLSKLAIGANKTILTSSGSAPQWSASIDTSQGGTGLTSYSQGDLLYYNTGTTLTALAKNTTATRYLSNTGANNNPAWAQIDLTNGVTGVLPAANGGTGVNNSTRTLTVNSNSGTLNFTAASKTLGISNSITLAGTDSTTMTFPSTNATIARTDAAQTFTGLQTFNDGAAIGSTSLAGQIVKARQNYYQIRDARTVSSGTVNFLSIDIGASTYAGLAVRIFSMCYAPGNNNFARAEEIYIKRASSGGLTITSKLAEGDTTGNTVTYSVSGNIVYLTYTYVAVAPQSNFAYVEIIGMNAATTAESAFTVTVL